MPLTKVLVKAKQFASIYDTHNSVIQLKLVRNHGSLSFESVAHFELGVHAPLLGSGERAAVDTFVSKKEMVPHTPLVVVGLLAIFKFWYG